ncbi:MAG TPA: TadE/TadG family type IV pilus assembly protein [Patescibacteria group bacterium]|nr:TadE/TadG family type IV pilus assembly protein [Patescibacteria group bacterium]
MIRLFRRWLKNEEGVTAVEFSLVAMPMFTLIFGIIELSMFFASGTVLEGASAEAARRIRTGQVQQSEEPEEEFKKLLCDQGGSMLDCDKIQYEVIHVGGNSFSIADTMEPEFDDEGNLIPHPFDAGSESEVVMVRTFYKWTFYTPFIGSMLTAGSGQDWIGHMSTVVIRTEPYCTSLTVNGCGGS